MRIITTALILLVGFIMVTGCTYTPKSNTSPVINFHNETEIIITDDLSRTITLPHHANRIVSLSSDATTMLLVVKAGKTLMGVSGTPGTTPYLAEKMPNAISLGGSYSSPPDVEKIVTLNPDVVILMTTTNQVVAAKLNQTHIPYIYIDGYKLAEIPREISVLGVLTGRESDAEPYNAFFHKFYNCIEKRIGDIPNEQKPTVYYEGGSDFSTVGDTSGGDSLIRMAGGRNIAGNISTQWPVVSPEWVIQQNPEVMFKIAYQNSLNNSTMEGIFAETQNRVSLSQIKAVRNNRVFVINHDIAYNTMGIIALMYMAKACYPDQFADINPDDMVREYDQNFLPGSWIDNPYYPDLN